MKWNWQHASWPHFHYPTHAFVSKDREFLQGAGGLIAVLNLFKEQEKKDFVVEILSVEGLKSAQIEGEILERESLQSSIRQHFGLKVDGKKLSPKEKGVAELMCSVYETYSKPLTHEMLHTWHRTLMKQTDIEDLGQYRTHPEPMQIVSRRYGDPTIYFEAPPSHLVEGEMSQFIEWFNASEKGESIVGRASQAHVYFESIHPFEDGNGRIGRALVEKALSQSLGHPTLMAISQVIEARKKEYYQFLGECNRTLEIERWVTFFSEVILQAQSQAIQIIHFLVNKSKLMSELEGHINSRQERALLRVLAEGPAGFAGGLSAEKYMAITRASRATATRDLVDLVDKGALVKTGQLRHTRYWIGYFLPHFS